MRYTKKMNDYKIPGQLIEALLEDRGWSQRSLAMVLGRGETSINKMVSGKQPVDPELALALEDVFGVPADTFLELQRKYDLSVARLASRPDPSRATRALLFGDLPISEMIERGWIKAESVRDKINVERELMRFFGVNRLEDIEIMPHAAKKTQADSGPSPSQIAWLYRVRAIAQNMLAPKFSSEKLRAILPKLKELMIAPEEARKVSRLLMECGVRLVLAETLASAKIDGVCFWLDDSSPVIGLALRFDRIDNFWFVLRHEIEHVLQEHGRAAAVLDAQLEGERAGTGPSVTDEERVANQAAAEFCVPQHQMDAFIARKSPLFSESDLRGFARILRVHPGIVAGQLQHKTQRFHIFRAHLVKIRTNILSSAMVDGWGTVAPLGN